MSLEVPWLSLLEVPKTGTSSDIKELQIPNRYGQWLYEIGSLKALQVRRDSNTVWPLASMSASLTNVCRVRAASAKSGT